MRKLAFVAAGLVGLLGGCFAVITAHGAGEMSAPGGVIFGTEGTVDDPAWLASLPEEKRKAVLSAETATAEYMKPDGPVSHYREPFDDQGSAVHVALAKREAVRLLTAQAQLSAQPARVPGQKPIYLEPEARNQRALAAAEVWAPIVYAKNLRNLESGFDDAVSREGSLAFSEAHFIVDEWQGVSVTSAGAYVQVLGHDRYHFYAQGWADAGNYQYQLKLVWADDTMRKLLIEWWGVMTLPGTPTGP